jgi:hypothetical protein
MTRGSSTTRTIAVVSALALALGLAGCSNHLDAGSGAGEDFAEHFRAVDGIASVDGNGTNNLPFSGAASVRAELDPHLSDARVTQLVDDMGRYMADNTNGSLSWSGRVVVDGYEIPLATKKAPNHRLLAALETVRHDERFAGGEIDGFDVAIGAADPHDLVAAWDRAREVADAVSDGSSRATVAYAGGGDDDTGRYPWSSAAWVLSSSDRDARDFPDVAQPPSVAGTPTPSPTAASALPLRPSDLGPLVGRIAAVAGVVGAVVTPSTVAVHTETAAQSAGVRSAVAALLPSGVQLLVSGGAVHRSGTGDYGAPDRMVAAVTAAGVHVQRVEETPTSVGFVVSDVTAARAVASAVGAVADPGHVGQIDIVADPRALSTDRQPDRGFAVSAPPDAVVRAAEITSAVAPWSPARIELPTIEGGQTQLWLSASSTTDFPALTRTVRRLGLDGASGQVQLGSDGDALGTVVNFTVGDPVTVDDAGPDEDARRAAAAFRDAWRDAG